MKRVVITSLITASFCVSTAFAACPESDTGGVDYDAIPIIVKDRSGDVSGFSTYYWDSTNNSWSNSEITSNYIYDTNAALDLKSLGLCLDNSSEGGGSRSALTLFLRIKMNGFPGAYKDKESGKVYMTGTGPLAGIATNPETFSGSMVFKIADAAKLSRGTHVYFMVASFTRSAGEFSIGSVDSDPGPQVFYLMKSKETISSKAEFDAMRFTSADSEFVADLDDHGQEGEPGDGSGKEGSEEESSGQEGDDFSQGVPTEIHVAAHVAALSEYANINKNSLVLVSAEMTTEVATEEAPELSSNAVAVSDGMKSAKGRLKKIKKAKKK